MNWATSNTRGTNRGGAKIKPKAKAKVTLKKPSQPAKPKTPPFDPTAPLDARGLQAQVDAATSLQYGGVDSALQGERNVSAQMMRNIPSWFADYQNALRNATTTSQAAYDQAAQDQRNTASSVATLDATQRGQMLDQMRADAQQRGATVDPNIDAKAQQAAASRQDLLAQYSNLTKGLGASSTAWNANREVVGAGQRLSALAGERNRAGSIESKAGDIAREKGAFRVKARQDLIDREHTKNLERKAFKLDVTRAANSAASDAAAIADRRQARITSNRNSDQDRAERRRAALAREQKAKAKGGSVEHRRQVERNDSFRLSVLTGADDAKSWLKRPALVKTPDGKPELDGEGNPTQRTRKRTEAEVREALRNKYKDRDLANAAMDMAINGYISPENERRLKARGIGVPREWMRNRPKPKPKTLLDIATQPTNIR